MPDELFMTISTVTGREPPSVIRTSSMAAAESEWIDTDPPPQGARARHAPGEGGAARAPAGARREGGRLPLRAMARDRLQRLGDAARQLRLLVDALEQL